jgi:hypothetical protein
MSVLTNKKVLLPLATAALAGALAVGSGADFTSTSGSTATTVTSGTLKQTSDKTVIFNQGNLKPGDLVTGTVTITNTGSLRSIFTLSEGSVSNTFSSGVLTEKIEDVTGATPVSLYSGAFGGAKTTPMSLGTFAPGEARTYKVTVALAQTAGNTDQGKTASEAFTFDATQESGTTYNQ